MGTYLARGIVSVADKGASPDLSAADNTTAFNAAFAAANASNSAILVPSGTYNLNALSALTGNSIAIIGYGAILNFNTTSDALYFHCTSPAQRNRVQIEGLGFKNTTNTPSSFIKIDGFEGVVLRCLQFSDAAATYCIDNTNAYGLKLEDSVFSDITGSGILLRYDSTPHTSVIVRIRDCDITRMSVDGIDAQGVQGLDLSGSVIESCTGVGLNLSTSTYDSRAVRIGGGHFESNGTAISCGTDGSTYACYAQIDSTVFGSGSTIALGSLGNLSMNNAYVASGNGTITGSAKAKAYLVNSPGWFQSGNFNFFDQSGVCGRHTWAGGGSPETLPFNINAGVSGMTLLFMLSRQSNTGNNTASAVYMVRFGYDSDNFTATKVAGDDGGIGAGASNFTFSSTGSVGSKSLAVIGAGGGNFAATWITSGVYTSI